MYVYKNNVTVTCSGANSVFTSTHINGQMLEINYVPGTTPISTANVFNVYRDSTGIASNRMLHKHFPAVATRFVMQSLKCTSSTQPTATYGSSNIPAPGPPWVFADEKLKVCIVSSATHANMEVSADFYFYTEPGGGR